MILFDAEFKVLDKEDKSIPRKDGNGTFDFTEVKLETVDKKPTVIIARLADREMDVFVGETYLMKIGITSSLATNGRVFNNFIVSMFKVTGEPKMHELNKVELEGDEIPF